MRKSISKIALSTGISLVLAFTFGCSSDDDGNDNNGNGGDDPFLPSCVSVGVVEPCPNTLTMPVDAEGIGSVACGGETYKTVKIGEQVWMAKNLNYITSCSKCLEDKEKFCNIFGRLYDWVIAMALPSSCHSSSCASQISGMHRGICPEGWHIPSSAEWDALISYVESDQGCTGCDARHLKAASGYVGDGGWYSSEDSRLDSYGFSALPGNTGFTDGFWWTASEFSSRLAFSRSMDYVASYGTWRNLYKSSLRSVRCLQD